MATNGAPARNPNMDYLDHFGEDGRKIQWDAEATGVAPILVVECFAGIGAPYVASAGLPMKTVAISEHSGLAPAQCAVWKHRAPEVTNLDDITATDFVPRMMELLEEEKRKNPLYGIVAPPTMIVGGSPCQAFSFAGKRQGLRDDRGNLALRFANVAIEGDFDIVAWENVPGALSDKTNGFGHLVGLLAGLKRGAVDWSDLISDAAFLKASETSEKVAAEEEGVIDLTLFMDGNPCVAEALLSDEAFRAAAKAETEKAHVLAGDLKGKAKGNGAGAKAARAVLEGDRRGFLDAMAESADPIDECLCHIAPFCVAPHELVSPEGWWTKTKGRKGQRWPGAGVVVGPERVVAWRVFDAQFYGVPQRRRRIFLFAAKAGSGIDPTKFLFDWPASQTSDTDFAAKAGLARKPDLAVSGEKGDVLVFVPDVKTKKFGTPIDSKNGGNSVFVEPHWGEDPIVMADSSAAPAMAQQSACLRGMPPKAKLSDPGFLIRGVTPDDKNLSGIAALGVEFRADGRQNDVPVRLLRGLDEAIAYDVRAVGERLRLRSAEAALRLEGVARVEAALAEVEDASPEEAEAMLLALAETFEQHVAYKPVKQTPGVSAGEAQTSGVSAGEIEDGHEDTIETIAAE